MEKIKALSNWIISGAWFVSIMRQVVMTGGNIAESMFLLGTLWVIVNAVAHTLITWVMSSSTIELFNYLSVVAFSALPELIIIPVIVICYAHWFMAINQKDKAALTWALLYTIPAGFFLVLTIMAITRFVSTGGNTFAPISGIELVIRCLSGWMYAVVNMLFKKLGEPNYESKLAGKDDEIKALESQIKQLEVEHQSRIKSLTVEYQDEISQLANQLNAASSEINRLAERASSLDRDVLACYPKVQIEWIDKAIKTVTTDQIESATGISKLKIAGAIRSGKLQKDNRNPEKIRVSSVIDWLRSLPVIESSNGHSEHDPLGLPVLTIMEN